jgi:16S rRNA processing protein RimM
MGRISAPFGVKGWVKVEPYTAAARNLLDYRRWWVGGGAWREFAVVSGRTHGRALLAKLAGCDDRDAAALLRGSAVAVPRAALPPVQPGEYYRVDLIGLRVVSTAGQDFGRLTRIVETGANDVLVVQGERERLIPFIAEVVRDVDLAAGVMRVDWGADY